MLRNKRKPSWLADSDFCNTPFCQWHFYYSVVFTITCTTQRDESRCHVQHWRSLLRTPVLLHLAPGIYCDVMRPRREGRPGTCCLSTSLCSEAQKSNGSSLRALHWAVWWCWAQKHRGEEEKVKIDKLHVGLTTDFCNDRFFFITGRPTHKNLKDKKWVPDNS